MLDQMAAPLDIAALAAQVTSPAQAAQVYAASLLAIDSDTDAGTRLSARSSRKALQLDADTRRAAPWHDRRAGRLTRKRAGPEGPAPPHQRKPER